MQKTSEPQKNYYETERTNINDSIRKIENLIDFLKYYINTIKSKEKNVDYIKVVIADMEEILRYKLDKNFKLIDKGILESQKEEIIEDKKEKIKSISSNYSLQRLRQIMRVKSDLYGRIKNDIAKKKEGITNDKNYTK